MDPSVMPIKSFQIGVSQWLVDCFGVDVAMDADERNHRFLEEALELVQAKGCTASEAHQLVDYVFNRPVGEPTQEVGGVMVTLAALCCVACIDLDSAADDELRRIWTKIPEIREKQAGKPKHSPLPAEPSDRERMQEAAVSTLLTLGYGWYAWHGASEWKPPLAATPTGTVDDRSPSYEALAIIVNNLCAALEEHGVGDDFDSPADAINALAQRASAAAPRGAAHPAQGDIDVLGSTYVLCKVDMSPSSRNYAWLYIPHADGNYVTAAKLVPFSMQILVQALKSSGQEVPCG